MKTILLTALLACAGLVARAQATPTQIAAIKALVTSKTWKTQATKINGLPVAEFEASNNIHRIDIFPAGNRFKFNSDGTFVIILAAGGSTIGVWDVNSYEQLVFNPGQDARWWHALRHVRRYTRLIHRQDDKAAGPMQRQ